MDNGANHYVNRYPEPEKKGSQWTVVIIVLTSLLVLAALIAVSIPFVATALRGPSGVVAIVPGQVHSTQWFNFTVHGVWQVDEYAGHLPAYGHGLWLVQLTQTGTFPESVPMGTWDWYLDSPDFRTVLMPHVAIPGQYNMMPEDFWLERNQSKTHIMLFEAPINARQLSLNFIEVDDRDAVGMLFTLLLQ